MDGRFGFEGDSGREEGPGGEIKGCVCMLRAAMPLRKLGLCLAMPCYELNHSLNPWFAGSSLLLEVVVAMAMVSAMLLIQPSRCRLPAISSIADNSPIREVSLT